MDVLNHYPIERIAEHVSDALAKGKNCILSAETGSGKTTVLPLLLRDKPWLKNQKIWILEPRRLAAKMAAWRMADLTETSLGEKVGYTVRNESCISAHAQIEIMTEGIFVRRIQNAPDLTDVGLIIFDEFHERTLMADVGLALALDVQHNLRPDLRLAVMSATLNADELSARLPPAEVLHSEGRLFPVTVEDLGAPESVPAKLEAQILRGIARAARETEHDILVFLPGFGEIQRIAKAIEKDAAFTPFIVHKLHSTLTKNEQEQAVRPSPNQRKIILSTSIAESSLTIEGVGAVVDSALERTSIFVPGTGMDRLITRKAARASLVQRQGRAGRLGPGRCYRLSDSHTFAALPEHHMPEIARNDLASLALELAEWGCAHAPESLTWITPPPKAHYEIAVKLLQALGALSADARLTPLGKKMVQIPLHPRLAHMVVQAENPQRSAVACDLAAILSEPDFFRRSSTAFTDIRLRLSALRGENEHPHVDGNKKRQVREIADTLRAQFRLIKIRTPKDEDEVGECLQLAFPDRIAQLRAKGSPHYLMSNGRAVSFDNADPLQGEPYLVVADYDDQTAGGLIRMAVPISMTEIRAHSGALITQTHEVIWQESSQKIKSRKLEKLGAIVLSERYEPTPDILITWPILKAQIEKEGLNLLPKFENVEHFKNKINLLHRTPAFANIFPDLSNATLVEKSESWLMPLMEGKNSFQSLNANELLHALQSLVPYEALARLDTLLPKRLKVPSGTESTIHYDPEKGARIAIRLQELFGLFDTPKVADHQIPITIEMLSPGMKVVQVTQDLRSFWNEGYFYVRKDFRGRYPKHYWPENPLDAEAIRGSLKRRAPEK